MSTENLPVSADDIVSAEPLPLVDHNVETRHVTADGDVILLETGTYQLPEKPKNLGNRFRAGALWNGNAKGRAKGTKNRITIQRLLMEEQLRDRLAVNAPDLLEKAVLMALSGDAKIMALLMDKLLATPKNDDGGDAKDSSINITIKNSTSPDKAPVATVPAGKVRVITTETQEPIDGEIEQ